MKNLVFIGAVAVAALGVFLALSSSVSRHGVEVEVGVRAAAACSSDQPAECLPELDFIDNEGNAWTRESLTGQVVMVNFWATWCAPCKTEIPALSASYQRYADKGFVLLGVMTDSHSVDDETLRSFSEETGLAFPVVAVDSDIWKAFDAPGALPTTFVYDRTGSLRVNHRGPLSESQLEEILDELLAEPALDR